MTLYHVNYAGNAFLNTHSILCVPSENSSGKSTETGMQDL